MSNYKPTQRIIPQVRRNGAGFVFLIVSLISSGCSSPSSLVFEQQSKSQISLSEYKKEGHAREFKISPETSAQEKENIKISVRYAPTEYLEEFFNNKSIFGKEAGVNPFLSELVVFHIAISNSSGKPIKILTERFVLLDDLNSQYEFLSSDYITALYEAKSSVHAFAKTTAQTAPGLYGASAGLASALTGGGVKRRWALLKKSILTGGYVHNNVIYDGFIAFLKPHPEASRCSLILSDIKLDLEPDDAPQRSIDFTFDFEL